MPARSSVSTTPLAMIERFGMFLRATREMHSVAEAVAEGSHGVDARGADAPFDHALALERRRRQAQGEDRIFRRLAVGIARNMANRDTHRRTFNR